MFFKKSSNVIFTGHFGSGKTEIAINAAFKSAAINKTSINKSSISTAGISAGINSPAINSAGLSTADIKTAEIITSGISTGINSPGLSSSGVSSSGVSITGISTSGICTAIIDLDIVNPFFRTADVRELLYKSGIRAVIPVYANTNVDVPALPAEVDTLIRDSGIHTVYDAGGDDIGAKVLSRYSKLFLEYGYEMYLVVNLNRLSTRNADEIKEVRYLLEEASGLCYTGIINNTHMMDETTIDTIKDSEERIEVVSEMLKLPVICTSVMDQYINLEKLEPDMTFDINEGIISNLPFKYDIFLMKRYLKFPWEYEGKK